MLALYASEGCPYAQRSRALLAHRGVDYELRLIDLKNKPAEFLKLSPTGRVPLLLDGENVLYESAIIAEYLVEKTGWSEAFSRSLFQKARERLAMLQFDQVLNAIYWGSARSGVLEEAQKASVERELDELERTLSEADSEPNLLGFHVAPHVIRWRWMGELGPMAPLFEARPALAAWVDRLAALPALSSTLPDRELTVQQMRLMIGR